MLETARFPTTTKKKHKKRNPMTTFTSAIDVFFLNLVIRGIFLKVVTCLYCWHGCVLQIINGVKRRQEEERQTDIQTDRLVAA